ncbi:hypothetical protein [Sulfitobacter sp. R18_1]|uniref:hypothetical protein n=1 Tax=Sulfitobacter sp. R18_1 TaxID=2821104 RepID=UPI001ADCCAD1|nr:hypothetical protein [Sulfitobacter sp. R18_1]MBO9428072.1 hypothetical protein [Sulfitobacter sp. R18_1]
MNKMDFIRELSTSIKKGFPWKSSSRASIQGIIDSGRASRDVNFDNFTEIALYIESICKTGSLDAASKLADMFLPGTLEYAILRDSSGTTVRICWWPYGLSVGDMDKMIKGAGRHNDDARAWLLAILEAKEAGLYSAYRQRAKSA